LDLILFFKFIILGFLLLLSSFFSGSETALFSLGRFQIKRLKEEERFSTRFILKLLEDRRGLIITILVGNELVNISASIVAASIFISILGHQGKWVAIIVMALLILLFGEIIPKSAAFNYNITFSSFVAPPLMFFSKMICPLRWVFKRVADTVMSALGFKTLEKKELIMEEEFRRMVDISHRGGELKDVERDLIHKVFEFSDAYVSEVMVPRTDMFSLPHNIELRETIDEIKARHYSRIPIYEGQIDNIVGILYVKDLLRIDLNKVPQDTGFITQIARKPYFVPETMRVDELFYKLQKERKHMAICVDEYGGVAGIVTMEDLLEELFGEIYDEYDKEIRLFNKVSDKVYRINAVMPLDEFKDLVGIEIIEEKSVDSVGGLVLKLFGTLPEQDATIEYKNLVFTVTKVGRTRILELLVEIREEERNR